jgi:IgA Peptidase M64
LALAARAQTATLIPVEENGPRNRRINVVFLSEGYTQASLPKFAGHARQVVDFLFAREPWRQYRSYCNVYRIEVASNQDGCDNGANSGAGGLRDTYFSTGFNNAGVEQLLTVAGPGSSRAYGLLNQHLPEYDVPIILVNDTKYGGSGGPLAVASVNGSSAAIVEHELGHSFANLADEYDLQFTGFNPSEMPNTTAETDRNRIRWRHWIAAATPVPTPETVAFDNVVGLFEGSMYRTNGWYRPHYNSLMRNLNRPVGAVNREQFVLNFYQRISPIEASEPPSQNRSVAGFESLRFQVTPKQPAVGPSLVTRWFVDGAEQPGATSAVFEVSSETLGNGTHTVTATVSDPTDFVRLDPSGLLAESVSWTLTLSGQLPPDVAGWRTAFGPDAANPAGDGLANLVKYALGLNPAEVAPADRLPTLAEVDGFLALTVPRRNRRADVDYVVEFSSDLLTWFAGPGQTMTVTDQETRLLVRDVVPAADLGQRFLRLKVQAR